MAEFQVVEKWDPMADYRRPYYNTKTVEEDGKEVRYITSRDQERDEGVYTLQKASAGSPPAVVTVSYGCVPSLWQTGPCAR